MPSENGPANNRPKSAPEAGGQVSSDNLSSAANKSSIKREQAAPRPASSSPEPSRQGLHAKGQQMSPEEAEAYRLYLLEKNQRRFSKAAAQVSEVTCKTCGLVLNANAKFCNRCGSNLGAAQPRSPAAQSPAAQSPAAQSPAQHGIAGAERLNPIDRATRVEQLPTRVEQLPQAVPAAPPRPQRRGRGRAYFIFAIGLIALLGITYASVKAYKKFSTQSESAIVSVPDSSPSPSPADQSAVQSTPSSDLNNARLIDAAKTALADGYRMEPNFKAWGRIADARMLLEQIPSDAPEFSEATTLISEIKRREAEKEKWDKLVARELHASNLERIYTESGRAIEISLAGQDKSIIKFNSALMSRQLVEQMTNDPEFTWPLRQTGFKTAIFTGSNLPTWTYDVATSEIAVSGTATKTAPAPVAKTKPVPAKTTKPANTKATRTPPKPSHDRNPPRRRGLPRETEQNQIDPAKRRKLEEKERKKREKELKKNRKGY